LDEFPTPAPQPQSLPFRLPAEYYSAPASEVVPLFPRWVPFGCGTAALVFLLLLFTAGSKAGSAAFTRFLDFAIANVETTCNRMFASDVTPALRAEFNSEIKQLRQNIQTNRAHLVKLQPILSEFQTDIPDKLVNAEETERLLKLIREANRDAAASSPETHLVFRYPR